VVVYGGRIPDFLARPDPVADAILHWPDSFIQQVEPSLLAVASGKPVSPEMAAQLEANQLVATDHPATSQEAGARSWRFDNPSRLTALGSNLAYHSAEFALQASSNQAAGCLERFVRLSSLGAEAAVLDVGCGAGQTLRLLHLCPPAERMGFDIDLEALAFGCRLAEVNGDTIRFLGASAHQIPFRDNRFTHVICRVCLNYLHQRRALREMVRVLRPEGYLYCSVEGAGFDFHFLREARSATQLLCRLRDLFYGATLTWWPASAREAQTVRPPRCNLGTGEDVYVRHSWFPRSVLRDRERPAPGHRDAHGRHAASPRAR
jgi:SAM-dependent methyltransferase